MSSTDSFPRSARLGLAWIFECAALAIHAADAAVHDFIGYYNSTVLTLYGHFSYFPRMDLQSKWWMLFPFVVVVLLLALTPYAYRNTGAMRRLGLILSLAGLLASVGQIALTIRGGSVPSVTFDGVSPGFYSSPLLFATSLYLFWTLRRVPRAT